MPRANEGKSDAGTDLDSDKWWHSPSELPLYASAWWDAATDGERRAYARVEAAAGAKYLIAIELYLLHVVLRETRTDRRADVDWLAQESAEEWGHIRLFNQLIITSGESPQVPNRMGRFNMFLLRRRFVGSVLPMIITYLAESYVLSVHNGIRADGASIRADVLHAVDIHVREERGHLAYARRTLRTRWPQIGSAHRLAIRVLAPLAAVGMSRVAYATPVGQAQRDTQRQAWRSPHHQALTVDRWAVGVAFLEQLGVITPRSRRLWARLGLV